MSAPYSTTYAKATSEEYDEQHEKELFVTIAGVIVEVSSDANVAAIRTGEAARALTRALAMVLALSPSAVRSPTAIRKITDAIGKRLRKQVAEAERDPDVQEFMVRRTFRDGRTEGSA
jgi:hypothetical protein